MSDLRMGHRQQLEDISSQLLLFESSLRGKEKQLQDTLCRKDQVLYKRRVYDKNPRNIAKRAHATSLIFTYISFVGYSEAATRDQTSSEEVLQRGLCCGVGHHLSADLGARDDRRRSQLGRSGADPKSKPGQHGQRWRQRQRRRQRPEGCRCQGRVRRVRCSK